MDLDKFSLIGTNPVDKVVQSGMFTVTNNGATSQYFTARIIDSSIVNSYGKKCFVRYRWNIDGGAWQSKYSHDQYQFTLNYPGGSQALFGLRSAVSVGVSDTDIYFRTGNGDHGNVTMSSGGAISYTPISHVFNIEYALFVKD